jgi:hypothetical protein
MSFSGKWLIIKVFASMKWHTKTIEAFAALYQPRLSLTDAKIPRPRSERGKGPVVRSTLSRDAERREG